MKQLSFIDDFINTLHLKFKKRSLLVNFIAENLKIEKESASRRLSKKVAFTIDEVAILSLKLDISLDSLLKKDEEINFSPIKVSSSDELLDMVKVNISFIDTMSDKATDMGCIFNAIPIEFCVPFPYLCKFFYYKWECYAMPKKITANYSTWKLPDKVTELNAEIIRILNKYRKIFYIWDLSAIARHVQELAYFEKLNLIDSDDIYLIKNDLHKMLHMFEAVADNQEKLVNGDISFYISDNYIDLNAYYYHNKEHLLCTSQIHFIKSAVGKNKIICKNIYNWINSMKDVSILISGDNEKERKLFFNEQHKIIGYPEK